MRAYNGYRKGTPTQEREKLPIGGYVIKIMDAEEVTYTWGSVLKISFDILNFMQTITATSRSQRSGKAPDS